MPELSGQNIPDLGNLNGDKPAPKIGGFPPMIMIRHLDEDGAMTPETTRYNTVQGPGGEMQVQAQQVIGRKNIVTAEDLVEMMREMVKEETQTYVGLIQHIYTHDLDSFLRVVVREELEKHDNR